MGVVAFENHRRNLGYSNGLVFWMFNDCWPAALGWSFIDYYRLPKASYYAFKRLSAPVVTSIDVKDGKYLLFISADRENAEVKAMVKARLMKNGKVIDTKTFSADHKGYGATASEIPFAVDPDAVVICDTEWNGGNDRCFYKHGDLKIVPTDAIEVKREGNGVTVTAKAYVHALEIEGISTLEDNYFSLLEGESRSVTVPSDEEIAVTAYTLKV